MGLLIEKGKMFVDDASGLTPTEVRSRARRIHRDHGGLSMIMIDYLQLMTAAPNQKKGNREQEISSISRALKGLAKELNVPVIALSQLSRTVETRVDQKPMLSDLRESGSIEQDADLILLLYNDKSSLTEFTTRDLIIAKHRNGCNFSW